MKQRASDLSKTDTILGNTLIKMYTDCGSLSDAEKTFNELAKPDIVSWTNLIQAHARLNTKDPNAVLRIYQTLKRRHQKADSFILTSVLGACNDLEAGRKIHREVRETLQSKDILGNDGRRFFGNSLISMYSRCGSLKDAREVFDAMKIAGQDDVVTWNSIINAYVKDNKPADALRVFHALPFPPTEITLVNALGASALLGGEKGLQDTKAIQRLAVKGRIFRRGTSSFASYVGNLIKAYSACGALEEAVRVFEEFVSGKEKREHAELCRVARTAMMAAYVTHDRPREAVDLFMAEFSPPTSEMAEDAHSFTAALKACVSIGPAALHKGIEIHKLISADENNLLRDAGLVHALIEMYARCGTPQEACEVLVGYANEITPELLRPAWATLMAIYQDTQQPREAMKLYDEMVQKRQLKPDRHIIATALMACSQLGWLERGRQLHQQHIENSNGGGSSQADAVLVNALITMYGKCGDLDASRKAFNDYVRTKKREPFRDNDKPTLWTALMVACVSNGQAAEALELFDEMQKLPWKLQPDVVAFSVALNACAKLGWALELGRKIHQQLLRNYSTSLDGHRGLEGETNPRLAGVLANGLIDMYSKCGSLEEACKIWESVKDDADVIAWTTMIMAYGKHGQGNRALELLDEMKKKGLKPDEGTYLVTLSACSHAGLVEEGLSLFEAMKNDKGIRLTVEHHNTVIDLLGRAGRLSDAEEMSQTAGLTPSAVTWMTILGACRIHGNVDLAERAAAKLFELEPNNASAYVILVRSESFLWQHSFICVHCRQTFMRPKVKLRIRNESGQCWRAASSRSSLVKASYRSKVCHIAFSWMTPSTLKSAK